MLSCIRGLTLVAWTLSVAGLATPQETAASTGARSPTQVGSVISTQGPQGAVIVVRGSQAYSLVSGDFLFEGDRIVTRSNGSAKISANGCEKTLEATTSIVVNSELCNVVPIKLVNTESVGALALPPPPSLAVGATPFLFPGLLAAGGAAAAVAGSGSSTSEVF